MLVKKGQNNKIINLHDKTVIYTSRFVYTQQDSQLSVCKKSDEETTLDCSGRGLIHDVSAVRSPQDKC